MVRQRQVWRTMVIFGSMIGSVLVSSCRREPVPTNIVDLSHASMDTVVRIDDDRTSIIAVAGAHGSLALVSDTAPFLEMIDGQRGAVQFGASGDGPGEFRFPSGVAWTGDTLFVWDPSQGRLSVLDRRGGLLGVRSAPNAQTKITLRMLRNGYGNPGRIAATPGGVVVAVYPAAVRQEFALWPVRLVHIRPDGTLDTLPIPFPSVEQLSSINQNAQELVAVPLWASCGGLGVVTWDPVGGVLRRYSTAGRPGRSDPIGRASTPLTDDLIRLNLRYQLDGLLQGKRPEPEVYGQMIESMLQQSRGGPRPSFPTVAPAFVSMQCDEAGTVWLQQFSLEGSGSGMGRTWTLVDPAAMVSEVRLPPDLRVLGIADGAVWGVRTGEDERLFLLRIGLPMS